MFVAVQGSTHSERPLPSSQQRLTHNIIGSVLALFVFFSSVAAV